MDALADTTLRDIVYVGSFIAAYVSVGLYLAWPAVRVGSIEALEEPDVPVVKASTEEDA